MASGSPGTKACHAFILARPRAHQAHVGLPSSRRATRSIAHKPTLATSDHGQSTPEPLPFASSPAAHPPPRRGVPPHRRLRRPKTNLLCKVPPLPLVFRPSRPDRGRPGARPRQRLCLSPHGRSFSQAPSLTACFGQLTTSLTGAPPLLPRLPLPNPRRFARLSSLPSPA